LTLNPSVRNSCVENHHASANQQLWKPLAVTVDGYEAGIYRTTTYSPFPSLPRDRYKFVASPPPFFKYTVPPAIAWPVAHHVNRKPRSTSAQRTARSKRAPDHATEIILAIIFSPPSEHTTPHSAAMNYSAPHAWARSGRALVLKPLRRDSRTVRFRPPTLDALLRPVRLETEFPSLIKCLVNASISGAVPIVTLTGSAHAATISRGYNFLASITSMKVPRPLTATHRKQLLSRRKRRTIRRR